MEGDSDVKNQRVMAVALTLLALGVLTQAAPRLARGAGAQGNEAALTEALKRLEKTLTRHGSKVSGGVIRRFDAKDFRGCRITFELTPQLAPDHKGYVPFTERAVIDLSTLDPAGIEVRGGKGTAVGFVTRDGRPTIEYRVSEEPHAFGDASWLRAYHISLTSRAAAEEARAALVRAVELCGR
jgi:hypothetical protein